MQTLEARRIGENFTTQM